MHFKLIITFIDDSHTKAVVQAARESGATGATIIGSARGEGIEESTTFLGLTLDSQRDVVFFLVEEHMSRDILEHIAEVGEFDDRPGTGIAIQIDVEDAVGVVHQIKKLSDAGEEKL